MALYKNNWYSTRYSIKLWVKGYSLHHPKYCSALNLYAMDVAFTTLSNKCCLLETLFAIALRDLDYAKYNVKKNKCDGIWRNTARMNKNLLMNNLNVSMLYFFERARSLKVCIIFLLIFFSLKPQILLYF